MDGLEVGQQVWLELPGTGRKSSLVRVAHIGKKDARVVLIDWWGNHAPGSSVRVPFALLSPQPTITLDFNEIAKALSRRSTS